MRFCNNELADISSLFFSDKVDYFNLSHFMKKDTIYMFFMPVYVRNY